MQSEILYFFRTAKHLPQKAVADVLGMSQPNYSDLENGITRLNPAHADKLGKFYEVSKEVFLENQPSVINNNGTHSKGIINSEQYNEQSIEILKPILEKIEILITQVTEEKKELANEQRFSNYQPTLFCKNITIVLLSVKAYAFRQTVVSLLCFYFSVYLLFFFLEPLPGHRGCRYLLIFHLLLVIVAVFGIGEWFQNLMLPLQLV